eukprot:15055429-Ditylum_brightwellii.AAC.1
MELPHGSRNADVSSSAQDSQLAQSGATSKLDLNATCYVDADFAGNWQKADAESADAVMSRTGYVLMYAGCPINW